jgi:single-strand DNA-binding protein
LELNAKGSEMINKVILVGNLGQDPDLKYTQAGTAVVTLSVATSRVWKNKEGNKSEETEWHRVIVWAKSAEFCSNYLKKGNRVYVEGRLQTRKWQDNNGADRYTTEIVAGEIKSLTSKGDNAGGPPVPNESSMGPVGDDVPF